MRRRAPIVCLLALGCSGLTKPKPTDQGPPKRVLELGPDDCKLAPGAISLAGMEAADRQLIFDLSRTRVVPVRLVADGCHVRIKALDRCRLTAAYRPIVAPNSDIRVISDAPGLFQTAPIGAGTFAGHMSSELGVMVTNEYSGRLEIPPDAEIPRETFQDGECQRATHVIKVLHVGRVLAEAGDLSGIEKLAAAAKEGRSESVPENMVVLDSDGSPEACRDARTKKAISPECDRPVAVELVALDFITTQTAEPKAGKMLTVAGGSFFRGAKIGVPDAPGKKVDVPTFQIDRTEVSAAEYGACVRQGSCSAPGTGPHCNGGVLGKERHPINCITWAQAHAYCQFAGKRLPTETEWEKAARGDDGRTFPWGEQWPPPKGTANLADEKARDLHPHWRFIEGYDDGSAGTSPVDGFAAASPSGALGMVGNVLEWTADYYDPKSYGPASGTTRTLRGSSFGDHERSHVALQHRTAYRPDVASMHFGVRCARSGSGDTKTAEPKAASKKASSADGLPDGDAQ